MTSLKNKDFLKLLDFSPEEIAYLLELAAELKAKKKAGIPHALCQGKNIALIFEKTSTRTRCAFEVAGHDLGMGVTYLDPSGSTLRPCSRSICCSSSFTASAPIPARKSSSYFSR